ncbi:dephospho-CoA kinase [Desulfovibrio cuneatus]|uniref:dephospho-CoA kinase n=1 Tax=Desulfovibrio cuneatus TaxID=159728 RepID=UPI00040A6833|nr:dephospho-CoA kinase [Desulfovibrio cuneatus]
MPINSCPQATHTFTTPAGSPRQRLDKLLAAHLAPLGYSRERVKDCIKQGQVLLDGAACLSPKEAVPGGVTIAIALPERETSLKAEVGELCIVYQDDDMAVVNKPADLTVHPCPGRPEGTLAHILLHHFPDLHLMEGSRPGIVHRLDKDTTGLLLVALHERARLALAEQFAQRGVYKEYLALVHGVPRQPSGEIHAPIGRHPTRKTLMAVVPTGREAHTGYTTLHADKQGRYALLAVRIYTGRTHQIRVHLKHIGHPLLGDYTYGAPQTTLHAAQRPMLHAWRLAVTHPSAAESAAQQPLAETSAPNKKTAKNAANAQQEKRPQRVTLAGGTTFTCQDNRLAFACPPPPDFIATLTLLAGRFLPVVITGSPGCGKSRLLQHFAGQGYPTLSADAVVAELYKHGADGWQLLRARFGTRFIPQEQGGVDKTALGAAMMADEHLRREVEAMLHPMVFHAIATFWNTAAAQGAPLAFAEIPLYLETGATFSNPGLHMPEEYRLRAPALVGVHAPFAVRQQRLAGLRGWSQEAIDTIEGWQWPEEQKMAACQYVLENSAPDPEGIALAASAAPLEQRLLAVGEEGCASLLRRLETLWATPPQE